MMMIVFGVGLMHARPIVEASALFGGDAPAERLEQWFAHYVATSMPDLDALSPHWDPITGSVPCSIPRRPRRFWERRR